MKIKKNKLKVMIEKYLKESLGDPPSESLIDINPKIRKELENISKINKANNSPYTKEYNKKAKMVIDNINFIYDETVKKFNEKSKAEPEKYAPLTEIQKKYLKAYLKNVRVVLVTKIPPSNSYAAAAGLAWVMGKDEKGKREVSGMGTINMSDITDKMVLVGKEHLEAHRKNPKQNPLILISSDKHRNPFLVISPKDLADSIVHELDHIKYGMLYLFDKKFNVKEVELVLRKDLIGKSKSDVFAILGKEGLFPNEPDIAIEKRIKVMYAHYKNIFGNKEKIETEDYEEFAVRINILTRSQKKEEIIKLLNNDQLSVSNANVKYGRNIGQLIPFLKKPVKISDLNNVVKMPDSVIKKYLT